MVPGWWDWAVNGERTRRVSFNTDAQQDAALLYTENFNPAVMNEMRRANQEQKSFVIAAGGKTDGVTDPTVDSAKQLLYSNYFRPALVNQLRESNELHAEMVKANGGTTDGMTPDVRYANSNLLFTQYFHPSIIGEMHKANELGFRLLTSVGGDTSGFSEARVPSANDLLYNSHFNPAVVHELKNTNELAKRFVKLWVETSIICHKLQPIVIVIFYTQAVITQQSSMNFDCPTSCQNACLSLSEATPMD